jgi:predicted nucleic acid-binding protein
LKVLFETISKFTGFLFIKKRKMSKEVSKKILLKLRWVERLHQSSKQIRKPLDALTQEERLKRYTNFSLNNLWEKYRFLQTHLLLREAALLTLYDAPYIFDSQLHNLFSKTTNHATT